MIRARLDEDFFFLGSVTPARAARLCPAGLTPVLVSGKAWLAVAVARLRDVQVFRVPVSSNLLAAGLLLPVYYYRVRRPCCKGNLFLRGFTNSAILARGSGLFERVPMQVERDHRQVLVSIPGLVTACVDLEFTDEPPRPEPAELFHANRSGVIWVGGRPWYLALRKSHWRMTPRRHTVSEQAMLSDMGATIEACLDTSSADARWSRPRRIPRSGHTA